MEEAVEVGERVAGVEEEAQSRECGQREPPHREARPEEGLDTVFTKLLIATNISRFINTREVRSEGKIRIR